MSCKYRKLLMPGTGIEPVCSKGARDFKFNTAKMASLRTGPSILGFPRPISIIDVIASWLELD